MVESELQRQRQAARTLVSDHLDGRIDRRSLLKLAGAAGISVPVLSAALGARGVAAQDATPGASAEASPAAEAPVTLGNYEGKSLKTSIAMAEEEAQVFRDVVVAGFKQTTGGDIEVINIEATDLVRTLQAQKDSGNVQIDLLVVDNNSLGQLVSNQLVDKVPEATEVMPPTTIEALKPVLQFDNEYWFLPARPNVQITYYNSTKFKDWGLEPPKTWDELKSVAQSIKDKAGVGQVSIQGVTGGAVGVTVTQFLWQAGGDPLKINTEQGAAAFQLMQDLKPNLTPQYPTATFDTTNTYLLNESVVLAQNWPFGVVVIVEQGEKKDVLAYVGWEGPAGNALVLGGDVFGFATGSKNRDMALDFTKYWMTKAVQEQLVAKNGWPAMRSDALGDVADWQKPYFDVVNQALAVTKARPNVPYWADVENALGSAFNDVVTGGQDVKDTLERYQQEIDKAAGH